MPTNGTKNRDSSVEVGLSTESKPAQINIVLDDELSIYQVSQVAPLFKNALASASADGIPVRVDMSAVMECDGAGLQLLLALSRAAHTAGLNVELIGLQASVLDMLDVFGVVGQFEVGTKEATQ